MTAPVYKILKETLAVSVGFTSEAFRFKGKGVLLFSTSDILVKVQFQFTPYNFDSTNFAVQFPFALEAPNSVIGISGKGFIKEVDLPDGTLYAYIDTFDTSAGAGVELYYMPNEY